MPRRNRDIIFVERDASSPLWWLVAGGALGAGLALLFAPDSGSATRRILARRLARLRSSAEAVIGEFRNAVESEDPDAADAAESGEEEEVGEDDEEAAAGEDQEGEVDATEEVPVLSARDELEKRLAAARARRQRELAGEEEEPVA